MAVTLRDLARHLNLSHATVSFVLNDRRDISIPQVTRDRVMLAAKELGYQPNRAAKALSSGRTQMIALWTPSSFNSYYASILYRLQSLARESGYDMIYRQVVLRPGMSETNLRSLAWPVDAVLAVDSKYLLETVSALTTLPHPPIVSVGAYTVPHFDSITLDLYAGATKGLEHLFATGRRTIGFIHPPSVPGLDDPRKSAYLDFCERQNHTPVTFELSSNDRNVIREETCALAKRKLIPSGLFCYNDHMAISVIRGLKDAGLVLPRDCGIVACDGVEEAEFTDPPLTTVAQPVEQMCLQGWDFMTQRIHNPKLPIRSVKLEPELVVRSSSDPA